MKNYKDLYKQQESKMRISGNQGSYYGQQSQNQNSLLQQQQPSQSQQQQNQQQGVSQSSSISMKQQQSSQHIISGNKTNTKTPLSSLVYQSIYNNLPQQQQQKASNTYSRQEYQQQQQQQQQGIGSYTQQLYSHSQNVSANHSRDNSINKQRQNERKMSITAQPNNQIQQSQHLEQSNGNQSNNFYHHQHSHSHQIANSMINKQSTYGSNALNHSNNGINSINCSQINNSTISQGLPQNLSHSIQQSSNQVFGYNPTHKGSVVDSTIIQKLMKKQQQQVLDQSKQSYPYSQPQSFISSPKRSPKNSLSPNTFHEQPNSYSLSHQQKGGYSRQSSIDHQANPIDHQEKSNDLQSRILGQQSRNTSQQPSSNSRQASSISQQPNLIGRQNNSIVSQANQMASQSSFIGQSFSQMSQQPTSLNQNSTGHQGNQTLYQGNQANQVNAIEQSLINNKNCYQQIQNQISNSYSQSFSQKPSQKSSISEMLTQKLQNYQNNANQQQSSSQLNMSQNNISSHNIVASQNLNNGQNNNNDESSASQNTEKKPISFLNYLLLKEIAERNNQDVINNSKTSHIDIMASKMNTPNNANKVMINNFNENQSSVMKNTNNLYGVNYNVSNQKNSVHQSQQKQSQQDLDHSYLSKYSQLLQSQSQSKQISSPPSPFSYNNSHKSSLASTAHTNNMQATNGMNSYSINSQLPQQYSQQIPSTPTSTHRSQQQQLSKQQDYSQQQQSSKGSKNNISGIPSNDFAETNNANQTDDLRVIPSCESKNCFIFHYVIGKGGFGKVWKVEHRKTRQLFAMKEMSKSLVITKKSVNSVMNERALLSDIKNPFLVNMFYAFQDRENLHLVMDLMPGGDLRYHIGRQRRFSEEQTRFFVACIFMGLEYLHNNNIIHRDIKPENLVLDSSGYVRITDLGIARTWKPDNANDTSGTPGYMAPEVMCRQPHTFAVDYFALGVLAYEFMLGRRPYLGRSRKEIRDQILAKRVQIKKHEIPDGWSLEAADFINRLIERKPANRLGINGPAEVKNHPWIKNFPWQKLINKQIDAPFLPANEDNFDQKQQISLEDEQNSEIIQQNAMLLKRQSVQSLFNGYNYDGGALSQQLQQQKQIPAVQSPYPSNQTQYQAQQVTQSKSQYKQQIQSQVINPQQHHSKNQSNGYTSGYQNPFSSRNNQQNINNNSQNLNQILQYSNVNLKESNYNDNSILSVTKNNNNNSFINSSRVYNQNNNNNNNNNSRAGEKENVLPSRYSYDEVY